MRIRSTTALLFLCAGLTIAAHAAENPRRRPATTWDVSLAPEGEPGERFVMEGIVRSVDGRALPNAKVFVYHADSKGMYSGAGSGPRLASKLRTDAEGRYRIRSVFPGAYAGAPAHVHFVILEPTLDQGIVNVRRDGHDPTAPYQGFAAKHDPDGVWRLVVDLRPGRPSPGPYGAGRLAPWRSGADSAAWAPPRRDTTRRREPR